MQTINISSYSVNGVIWLRSHYMLFASFFWMLWCSLREYRNPLI